MTVLKFVKIVFVLMICTNTNMLIAQVSENYMDSLNREQGLWRQTMTEGKKKYLFSICNYKDGKMNGQCDYFYSNGKIMSSNFCINDTLNGERKVYRTDGTLFEIENHKMGILHGLKKYFDGFGRLYEEQEYKNGYTEGFNRKYYPNGRLEVETVITSDGKENGVRKIYKNSSNNELIREFEFINDVKIKARYYENGKVIKEENF